MTYHSYSMRAVEAAGWDEAAEVFAGRIARRLLGRLGRVVACHSCGGGVYRVWVTSKRRPRSEPVRFLVSWGH